MKAVLHLVRQGETTMAAAAASPHDGKTIKQIHLHISINFKRGKEEIEYAHKESERLHNLIAAGTERAEWAMTRLEAIQKLILSGPDADSLKAAIDEKLKSDEESD